MASTPLSSSDAGSFPAIPTGLAPSTPSVERIQGRSISKDKLIPTSWKIGMVVAVLFASTLITLAVLTGHGTFPAPDWLTRGLKWAAGIVGGAQVLSIPLLIAYYCNEKKVRQHGANLNAAAGLSDGDSDESDPLLARAPSRLSSSSSTSARPAPSPHLRASHPVPAPPPASRPAPISPSDWNTRLSSAPKIGPYYNLDAPDRPIARPSGIGTPQLPLFGKYQRGRGSYGTDTHLMAARLPSQQLQTFPVALHTWFEGEGVAADAECYFMVINNTALKEGKLNLALHAMALPEYNRSRPSVPIGRPRGVEPFSEGRGTDGGIQVHTQIALFEPQGVQVSADRSKGIANGAPHNFTLTAHGKPKQAPALSPDIAEFNITGGAAVSSAYFGATFRGRGVAIHALILNDASPEAGAHLERALEATDVEGFIKHLENSRFPGADQVRQTFTHPNEMTF